jgi:hypothetical protein
MHRRESVVRAWCWYIAFAWDIVHCMEQHKCQCVFQNAVLINALKFLNALQPVAVCMMCNLLSIRNGFVMCFGFIHASRRIFAIPPHPPFQPFCSSGDFYSEPLFCSAWHRLCMYHSFFCFGNCMFVILFLLTLTNDVYRSHGIFYREKSCMFVTEVTQECTVHGDTAGDYETCR